MKQYNKTNGLKGIHTLLKQFNEEELSEWQRNLLRDRLLILSWYDRNGRSTSNTAKEFETSMSHISKLVKLRATEGLGGLIPQITGPQSKRGFKLSSDEKIEIEKYAFMFPDWSHKKLKMFFKHSKSTIYRYLAFTELLVRDRCPGFHKKPQPRSIWKIKREKLLKGYIADNPEDLIVLDSITEFIGPNFKKIYFITCVDIATRIGFTLATETHNSKVASTLLNRMKHVL